MKGMYNSGMLYLGIRCCQGRTWIREGRLGVGLSLTLAHGLQLWRELTGIRKEDEACLFSS